MSVESFTNTVRTQFVEVCDEGQKLGWQRATCVVRESKELPGRHRKVR